MNQEYIFQKLSKVPVMLGTSHNGVSLLSTIRPRDLLKVADSEFAGRKKEFSCGLMQFSQEKFTEKIMRQGATMAESRMKTRLPKSPSNASQGRRLVNKKHRDTDEQC